LNNKLLKVLFVPTVQIFYIKSSEPSDAGNNRRASQTTIYENSRITIAGHARFRGCA
jgi:hypothetical protein